MADKSNANGTLRDIGLTFFKQAPFATILAVVLYFVATEGTKYASQVITVLERQSAVARDFVEVIGQLKQQNKSRLEYERREHAEMVAMIKGQDDLRREEIEALHDIQDALKGR